MLSTKIYSRTSLTKSKIKASLTPWGERNYKFSLIKAWETAWDFYKSPNKAQNKVHVSEGFINICKTTPRYVSGEKGCHVVLISSPSGRI